MCAEVGQKLALLGIDRKLGEPLVNKGLKLFGWILAGILFFFMTWTIAAFFYYLVLPDSASLATIAGFTGFVLPWCFAYGVISTRRKPNRLT